MMRLKKIDRKNIPHNFPLLTTVVVWLFLDRLNVSDLVWGIVGALVVLWWILTIVDIALSDSYDLLENK